jgi:hypothetical protein
MFFKEEFNKKTIIQIRWALIISVGYIALFSHPGKSVPLLFNLLFPLYALTNLLLSFSPQRWFQHQRFISLILLLDLSTTGLSVFLVGPENCEFYVTFFLVLLVSAITRKPFLVYSTFVIILVVFGVTSYIKAPGTFFNTESLLQFPFIVILALFFRGMVQSHNRVYQEKELLKEDYRELEILTNVALSIGQDADLPGFLFKLSGILSEKLGLPRCTAIFLDTKEDNCYMVSSDDFPGQEPLIIDVKNFPTLKELLKTEEIPQEIEESSPLPLEATSKYILKQMPISFKNKKLGTLYLRANTPKCSLTHREEYFLQALGRITAIAIMDLEKSLVLEKMIDTGKVWERENLKRAHFF